ncbi:MAG: PDZ domain-containing protein [Clostridia bacterium]|nr:PDZ domain-containing protein [Clostridia bacterium]
MKAIKKYLIITFTLVFAFFLSITGTYAKASNDNYLYLGGFTAGFNVNTKGVTIIGLTEVFTENGLVSPSKSAGLEQGDIILSLNGKEVTTSSDVYNVLKEYKSGYIVTQIERKGILMLKDVFPEKDVTGSYKLGVFLRDGVKGFGTVTYVKENGEFGSLGHPVTDENGRVLQVVGGNVYNLAIVGVNKAERGKTGELKGLFVGNESVGEITANSAVGLFGKFTNFDFNKTTKAEIGVAKIGSAKILSTVMGEEPKYYDVEILKTDMRNSITKNLVVKISDKTLINYTGGILQGMSGSPIIQNGKIVGAITHVFVNDSTRGFGISIQNMLNG